MARMNKQTSITGRPRERKPDTHSAGVREAHDEGLAAWALANGYVSPDGSPMIHTSRQRATVRRAMTAAAKVAETTKPAA